MILEKPASLAGFLLEQNPGSNIYGYMLQFKQNDTAVAIILTLTELITLPAPNFLFVFIHVTTKSQVAFVKLENDDESEFPGRYNKYTIDPAVLFDGQPIGEWHYQVYEQASASNVDPSLAGGLVESGKMLLDRSEAFAFKMYDSVTSYTTYNG